MSKKIFRTIVVTALLLIVIACAPAPAPVAPTSAPSAPTSIPAPTSAPAPTSPPAPIPTSAPKVLRVGQVGNIASLEPYRFALPNYFFIEQVFDQMIVNQEGNKVVAEAAESWELAPDNKSIKIKLRAGMTTHDGSKVDAVMLKWDLDERITKSDKGVALYSQYAPFYDRSEVVDPLTITIYFKVPAPHALDLIALLAVTDPDMFTKKDGTVALGNQEDKMIATGPFRMIDYVPGASMTFEKNKDYWEKDAPKLDRIEFRIFGNNASLVAALQAGEIDFAFRPAYQDAARLQKDPKFAVWAPKTLGLVDVLMLNPAADALKDARVRQAITIAIDRESINRVSVAGLGVPTGIEVPKNSLAYSADLELKTTADTAKAMALLKDANVTGLKAGLTYDSADEKMKLQAELIAENLRAVGITVTLDPTETGAYTQRRTSQQFDMLLSVVAGTNVHPAGLENSFVFLHVNNPFFAKIGPSKEYQDYAKAFDEGMAAKTPADAKTAWQKAIKAIHDGAWVTPLVATPLVSITSSKVKGLTWTESDKPVLKYVTIDP